MKLMNEEPKITLYPPLKKGEAFLGNTSKGIDEEPQYIEGLVLRRPAYDLNGEKLEPEYKALIAVDAYASSEYNRVRERQFKDICGGKLKPWEKPKS